MARRLSWTDVRGGIIVTVVLILVAAAILKFSRVGALHGDTFKLYALVGEARGVLPGSEVWLSGQKIGKITGIAFRSPAVADSTSRIQIDMEVLEIYRTALHRDAVAQIRSGGSLIGPPVVYLSPGTVRASVMQHDDTVRTQPQSDAEGAASQFTSASKEVTVIVANVKVLGAQLQTTQGTVGALLNGPGGGEMSRARVQALRMMGKLNGSGTVGRVMQGGVTARSSRVLARVDSVRALLASPNTSLGRIRRDSTLLREVDDIRHELTLVRADLDESRGSAGRFMHDSAIFTAVGAAEREMTALFADLKKHPMRYISF